MGRRKYVGGFDTRYRHHSVKSQIDAALRKIEREREAKQRAQSQPRRHDDDHPTLGLDA